MLINRAIEVTIFTGIFAALRFMKHSRLRNSTDRIYVKLIENHNFLRVRVLYLLYRISKPLLTLWYGQSIHTLGLYSRSGRMSYRQTSWSLIPRNSRLDFSSRSKIWQASGQKRFRDACQIRITEWCDNYNIQYRGLEASRDLEVSRPST